MRSLIVAGLLGGAALVAGGLGAGAQPWPGPGLRGPAAVPVADYPEPRFGYGDPRPRSEYDVEERRREGVYGQRPRYDAPPPRRFGPEEEEDEPAREGSYGPRPGYAEEPPARPRCWVRPGYDGPERVCRW